MFSNVIKLMYELRDEYAKHPEAISEDVMCMNGNDGEQFDWDCNGRCCEFYMYYKPKNPKDPLDDPAGAIKLCVNSDGTYNAYIYNKAYEDPNYLGFDEKFDVEVHETFPGNVRTVHNKILKCEDQGDYDFKVEGKKPNLSKSKK